MFETAELGRKVSRRDYEERVPDLRMALLKAQDQLKEAGFSVVLVVAGVDGAGKGETVNLLHEWMDARYLQTHALDDPTDEEKAHPRFWRFWRQLPPHGRIGIFFGSWYTDPIVQRVGRRITRNHLDSALSRINAFEAELVDNGALVVKLWFHLGKAQQKARLKALQADPATRWRVTRQDWAQFREYDRFRQVSERTLRETSTGRAPWYVIEGTDHRFRSLAAGEYLLNALTARLAVAAPAIPQPTLPGLPAGPNPTTILDKLDLSRRLGDAEYHRSLEKLQGRLNTLMRKAKRRERAVVIVFEGWDAAGKGGAIRRITAALDARDYFVIPVGAPTEEERAHHYLWRFWRHLPRDGRIGIFDRSWYGRVLVERVEGLATESEWRRAYAEINEFEEQQHEHGTIVLKFWMHIDQAEQLRRFKEREQTSFKQFKITEDDFRNREKWNAYERTVNEMVERTSTEFAPWILVEANDKHYGRIKVLDTLCDRLEREL